MTGVNEVLWPGGRAIGRAVRWAAIGFFVGYAAGLLDLGSTDVVGFLAKNSGVGLALAGLTIMVAGTLRSIDGTTFERIRRTHVDLPEARSPVGWAYALAIGTASFVFAAAWASGVSFEDAGVTGLVALVLVAVGAGLYVTAAMVATAYVRPLQQPFNGPERPHAYFADHPISSADEDVLERGPIVTTLVEAILDLHDAAPGFVSLEGDWGSGKSSVVALAGGRLRAKNYMVEVFSGFHFATTDRLVEALVVTIERSLNERYATMDVSKGFRSYYRTLRPVVSGALPFGFGLPEMQDDRQTAKHRLEAVLASVRRPIVVFLEDLDRMRGADLLTLLAAVQLLGSIKGFVFVLVLDRDRCSWQLRDHVPDPDEYLRKSIHAAIPLPEPPPNVLGEQLNRMLDQVLEARAVKLTPPPRLAVQWEDWLNLAPTLRHLKQLVNAYSTTLALLGGEIDPFDALIANALDEAAPEVLDMIAAVPWPWLDGLPQFEAFAAAMKHPSGTDKSTERTKALKNLALKRVRSDQIGVFIDALFPAHRPGDEAQAGQHMSEWEYFRRYRERGVRSSFLRDEVVASVLRDASAAGVNGAQQIVEARVLDASNRFALLNKLVVRAADLEPPVRLPAILACAAISDRLRNERALFEPTEVDRARAFIFSLLELERDDPTRQQEWMDQAVQGSAALDFARALVIFSTPDRNRILSDFTAFDQDRLKTVLAETIRSRLEGGYDPFESEPRSAPWILPALRDPAEASRWAVRLNGVYSVMQSVRPIGNGGEPMNTINWEGLLAGYEWKVLADSLPEDGELTEMQRLLKQGPGEIQSDGAHGEGEDAG